jgi:hypothetical protein
MAMPGVNCNPKEQEVNDNSKEWPTPQPDEVVSSWEDVEPDEAKPTWDNEPAPVTPAREPVQSRRMSDRAKIAGAILIGGVAGAAAIGPLTALAASPPVSAPASQPSVAATPAPSASAGTSTGTHNDTDTGHGGGGPGGHVEAVSDASVVAKAIGITEAELQTALAGGKTVAQVAADHNVSTQTVIDALVADGQSELDAAVKAGTMTQAQADQEKTELTQRATDQVNGNLQGGHH